MTWAYTLYSETRIKILSRRTNSTGAPQARHWQASDILLGWLTLTFYQLGSVSLIHVCVALYERILVKKTNLQREVGK